MAMATFKIGRKEFVVVPRRVYDQLTRVERDYKDSMIIQKAYERYVAGKVKTISHAELKRKLGL